MALSFRKKNMDAAATSVVMRDPDVCPCCQKRTGESFRWIISEDEWVCLMCHHDPSGGAKRVNVSAKLTRGSSEGRQILVRLGGVLCVVLALLVGSVYLFYKPKPLQPPPPLGQSLLDKDGKPLPRRTRGLAIGEPKPGENGTGGQTDGKGKDPGNPATTSTAAAVGSKQRERMAAMVTALIAEVPKVKAKADEAKKEQQLNTVSYLIEKAQDMAEWLGLKNKQAGGTAGPSLNPNDKTKAKLIAAKDSVLKMAGLVIDKTDKDGTKTVNMLGKLGAVSTTFADVADKLVKLGPSTSKGGGGGVGGGAGMVTGKAPQLKLEGDILEAQGRSGYDAMELMVREADAEEKARKAGKSPLTVRVEVDPKSRPVDFGTTTQSVPGIPANGPKKGAQTHARAEKKLNDTTIRLNPLDGKVGGRQTKLNDTTIRLNDTTIRLKALDVGVKTGASGADLLFAKLDEPKLKLNDTTIRLNDTTIRLNSTDIRLKSESADAKAVAVKAPSAGELAAARAISEAPAAVAAAVHKAAAGAVHRFAICSEAPVRRDKSVLRTHSLPASYLAALGVRERSSAGGAKAPRIQDVPVLILSLRGELLFSPRSTVLGRDAEIGMHEVAAVLLSRARMPVLVRGCANGPGDDAADASLSAARAEAVRKWLVAFGCIAENKIFATGSGTGDSPAPGRRPRGAAASPDSAKDRVTICIPLPPEGTF